MNAPKYTINENNFTSLHFIKEMYLKNFNLKYININLQN